MDFTNKRFTIWIHVIFWLCYLLLNTGFYISMQGFNITLKIFVTAVLHAIIAYLNLLVFLPKFFFKRKFYLYGLVHLPSFALIVVSIALFEAWYINKSSVTLNNFFTATISTTIVVTMIGSLKFLQEWYIQKQKEQALLFNQLEANHKMLRMQVNPHFLFNALNNIYSLANRQSKATGPAILKLSNLMRFLLYEGNGEKIPVQREIEYIQNYIGLQALKFEDASSKINFHTSGNTSVEIEPLLLIPFVENAFKHGNLEEDNAFVSIDLDVTNYTIKFVVRNSFDSSDDKKDSIGGVGLQNVKNRLEAHYTNKHHLVIKKESDIYTVDLSIELR